VIAFSLEAEAQVAALIDHYELKGRLEASENLLAALETARQRIAQAPDAGLEAPRPYPSLKRPGRRWIIEGRYWISYNLTKPPIISGVFYVMADIPNRL
jgi:plasmid stabilization system protein ParE